MVELTTAYQFALEMAKQEIVLATGLLGITIAFTKDLVKRVHVSAAVLLGLAWVAFVLSIYNGTRHIGALTAGVEYSATRAAADSGGVWQRRIAIAVAAEKYDTVAINDDTLAAAGLQIAPDARYYGMWQDDFFIAGLVLSVLYGLVAVITRTPESG